jgi:hypothetical protein
MRSLSRYPLKALTIAAGLAFGLLVTTTGCYVGVRGGGVGAEFEVDAPPPVVHEEVVLARPGPEFIWIGGYWDWEIGRRSYVWREGRWERPPHSRAVWVPAHYERRGNRHYYRRGHWRT